MSIYGELLEKAMDKTAKGMKKFVIILVLAIIAAIVAAYFIGRNAGKQAALDSYRHNDAAFVCNGMDDDCPDADGTVIFVPDHSEEYREIMRRFMEAREHRTRKYPGYVAPLPVQRQTTWEL